VVVLLVASSVGCGGSRTPEEVALDFATRLSRGDAAGAVALLSAEERAIARSSPEGAILGHDFALWARAAEPESRYPDWRLETSSSLGPETAQVVLSTPASTGAGSLTWPLVLGRESGAWRIRLRESEGLRDPEFDDADALALFRRLEARRRDCLLYLR
jgi:hypothetical protein